MTDFETNKKMLEELGGEKLFTQQELDNAIEIERARVEVEIARRTLREYKELLYKVLKIEGKSSVEFQPDI